MRDKLIIAVSCTLSLVVLLSACVKPGERPKPSEAADVPTIQNTMDILETLEATAPKGDPVFVADIHQEAQLPPIPFTEDEVVMLAKTIYEESQVLSWYGDNYGVSYRARQAAVAWCALNRYDDGGYGDTLAEILSRPAQFAYKADAPLTDDMLELARDVIYRWQREIGGEINVGRTLPPDYLFFEGDGKENHFRKQFEHTGETWDWSLPDPYKETGNG